MSRAANQQHTKTSAWGRSNELKKLVVTGFAVRVKQLLIVQRRASAISIVLRTEPGGKVLQVL